MINRNRDSDTVLSPRMHRSSSSSSSMYPHSPTTRMHHSSSSSSYQYPRSSSSSSTKHHVASPSLSLYPPTRTQTVREELARCEGMDSVIQYDDVRGYFDQVGLPTPVSMRRKTKNPNDMSLSSRVSGTTMPLPMVPIVGSPPPNALRPPLLSPPAMKSLTPPIPVHQDRQYGPASSLYYRHPSSRSSHSRNRNGQSIASGSHNTTHSMPSTPVPGPLDSRSVRYTQPKPGGSARSHRVGVYATQTRGEGSTAHARKRSTSGGIRIVTVYDIRGFEGVEPDPKFPNMMVVDRTGGEPMMVYRSGDVSGVGYDIYGVHGGTGNHDQSLGR
ncbi:hypothetical protein BJ165DRAFT_1474288 [Panaeolus papilionaceus]|nr:hypothetical protein BJ165DRAFT_1474288 [Panaeolus papilionaceus]